MAEKPGTEEVASVPTTTTTMTHEHVGSAKAQLFNALLAEHEAVMTYNNAASDTEGTVDEEVGDAEKGEEEEGTASAVRGSAGIKALPLEDVMVQTELGADSMPSDALEWNPFKGVIKTVKDNYKKHKAKKAAKKAESKNAGEAADAAPASLGDPVMTTYLSRRGLSAPLGKTLSPFQRMLQEQEKVFSNPVDGSASADDELTPLERMVRASTSAPVDTKAYPVSSASSLNGKFGYGKHHKGEEEEHEKGRKREAHHGAYPPRHAGPPRRGRRDHRGRMNTMMMMPLSGENDTVLVVGTGRDEDGMTEAEKLAAEKDRQRVKAFRARLVAEAKKGEIDESMSPLESLVAKAKAGGSPSSAVANLGEDMDEKAEHALEAATRRYREANEALASEYQQRELGEENLDGSLGNWFKGKLKGMPTKNLYPAGDEDATLPAVVRDGEQVLKLGAVLRTGRVMLKGPTSSFASPAELKPLLGHDNVLVYDNLRTDLARRSFFKYTNGAGKASVVIETVLTDPRKNDASIKFSFQASANHVNALLDDLVWTTHNQSPAIVFRFSPETGFLHQIVLVYPAGGGNGLAGHATVTSDVAALAAHAARTLGPAELALAAHVLEGKVLSADAKALVDPANARIALATAMTYMRTAFPQLEVPVERMPAASVSSDSEQPNAVLKQYASSVEQLSTASQAAGKLAAQAAAQQRGILLANHLKAQIAGAKMEPRQVVASLVALNASHTAVARACLGGDGSKAAALGHSLWNAPAELRAQPTTLYSNLMGGM